MKYTTHLWVPVLAGALALGGVQARAVEKSITVHPKGNAGKVAFGLDPTNTDNVQVDVYDSATPPNRIQTMQKDKQKTCWLKRGFYYTAKFSCTTGKFSAPMFAANSSDDGRMDDATRATFTASGGLGSGDVTITVPAGGTGLPLDSSSSFLVIGER